MSPRGGVWVAACAAAAVLIGTAAAGGAVPPYADTTVHPTEAEFQQFIAPYQQAIAASSQDADAYYWLGIAYWQASSLARQGLIPYGADYLPRAIEALERTVTLDPGRLGAWLVLQEAYATAGKYDEAFGAAEKLAALSTDISLYSRGMPPAPRRGGPVTVAPPARTVTAVPAPSPAFRAGDYTYAGDPATKKLYPLSCPRLPSMAHVAIFLNKWDAVSQGYTVAPCP